jgi:hypothetical protein
MWIVTDLALPGEDGARFVKWLLEQPRDQGGAVGRRHGVL